MCYTESVLIITSTHSVEPIWPYSPAPQLQNMMLLLGCQPLNRTGLLACIPRHCGLFITLCVFTEITFDVLIFILAIS